MKTLAESLFDKDLVDKYPVDLSFLKTTHPQERVDIFMTLAQLMTDPFHTEEWMDELYHDHESGFDHIHQNLYNAFKKQGFESWFNITDQDFEDMGDEMTDEEIDVANEELKEFFSKAYPTQTGGYFLIINKKLPDFLIKIIKSAGYWKSKMSSIDTWAIQYWPDYGPGVSLYGCPKGLNPYIKKLLYQ